VQKLSPETASIRELSQSHAGEIAKFECGSHDEDEFLKKDALANQDARLSKTYLLFESGKRNVISYLTLNVGSFKISENRKLFDVKVSEKPYHVYTNAMPCLRISKLATDKSETGRGGASLLVSFAVRRLAEINREIPIPFLSLAAYPDKVKFYEKLGFEVAFTPSRGLEENVTMYMHVKFASPPKQPL